MKKAITSDRDKHCAMFYVQTGRWAPRQPSFPRPTSFPSAFAQSSASFHRYQEFFTTPRYNPHREEQPYVETPVSTPAPTPGYGTPRANSPAFSVFNIESVKPTPVEAPSPVNWQTPGEDVIRYINKIEDQRSETNSIPLEAIDPSWRPESNGDMDSARSDSEVEGILWKSQESDNVSEVGELPGDLPMAYESGGSLYNLATSEQPWESSLTVVESSSWSASRIVVEQQQEQYTLVTVAHSTEGSEQYHHAHSHFKTDIFTTSHLFSDAETPIDKAAQSPRQEIECPVGEVVNGSRGENVSVELPHFSQSEANLCQSDFRETQFSENDSLISAVRAGIPLYSTSLEDEVSRQLDRGLTSSPSKLETEPPTEASIEFEESFHYQEKGLEGSSDFGLSSVAPEVEPPEAVEEANSGDGSLTPKAITPSNSANFEDYGQDFWRSTILPQGDQPSAPTFKDILTSHLFSDDTIKFCRDSGDKTTCAAKSPPPEIETSPVAVVEKVENWSRDVTIFIDSEVPEIELQAENWSRDAKLSETEALIAAVRAVIPLYEASRFEENLDETAVGFKNDASGDVSQKSRPETPSNQKTPTFKNQSWETTESSTQLMTVGDEVQPASEASESPLASEEVEALGAVSETNQTWRVAERQEVETTTRARDIDFSEIDALLASVRAGIPLYDAAKTEETETLNTSSEESSASEAETVINLSLNQELAVERSSAQEHEGFEASEGAFEQKTTFSPETSSEQGGEIAEAEAVPEPIPAQKHEYLSSAPPAVASSDPRPGSPLSSCYYSTYNTPYTSLTSVYYSAEDLVEAVKQGVPIYLQTEAGTSKMYDEPEGYETDTTLPGDDLQTDDTTIEDVYEMRTSGILSEEEEEQPFERNQSIRKSILPGARRPPTRGQDSPRSPPNEEKLRKSPEAEEAKRTFPVISVANYVPYNYYTTTSTTTETETYTSETRSTRDFRSRSPLYPHSPNTQGPIRRENGGGRVLKMVTEMGSATIGGISPALSANAAKSFLEATDKEKKELQGLNDRLGNYIDRVKRLEEQNRKLVADLDELRGKWGKDTSEIKIKYSESLSTARKDIDDSARRKAEIDVKAARLRDDLAEYRSRYEDVQHRREADREKISQWTNAIADAQSELEMLRARWKQLTDEEKRLNADNARIWEELQKARNDLDEETIGRIDFQNQVQTLMEELEFLRRVHEQEVKELQALLAQAPADTREFFKNELALAIRDIKDEYDYIAKQGKQDMESWYKLKVSEVQGSANRAAMESNYQREEVKRMRDNIGDLRSKLGDLENKNALLEKEVQNLNYQLTDDQRQYETALNDRDATLRRMREECQTLVAELQGLLDTKQMLDAEIAIYRKMLEGEESRVGLRQMVEQVVKTHSLQQQEETDSTRSVRGEVSTKTTFQRSAKGNVTIAECDPNGKFITLENTHRTKEENLGEHKLKRKLDGNRREIVYTIPAGTVLKPGKTMKIYARDQGGINNPPESLVFDGENTWGIGANVVTSLYNKEGEERATHTQKTIQTGQ